MKPKTKFRLLILSALPLLASCAHDTQKDAKMTEPAAQSLAPLAASQDGVSIEAKLAAAQDDTTNVTEVIFEKGTTRLSESDQDKIEKALLAAEKKAPLAHITIVSWSDAEMPKRDEKLSPAAIDLAKVRAKTIEEKIHSTRPKLTTEIVNMAERGTKLKRFLKTNDVRIREALDTAGTGDTKAAHAIVIIQTQEAK